MAGRVTALVVASILSWSIPGLAEERGATTDDARPSIARPSASSLACDASTLCRIASAVLSKIAEEQRTVFEGVLRRAELVVGESPEADRSEARSFEAAHARYVKFWDFNRRLERDRAEKEQQEFDEQISLAMKKIAFLKRWSEAHGACEGEGPPTGQRSKLYRRP